MTYSGYFGNEKYTSFKDFIYKNSNKVLFLSIKRMLPKTRSLMSLVIKNVKVYPEEKHPHVSQKSSLIFCN
jgi:ribosomal protein L13